MIVLVVLGVIALSCLIALIEITFRSKVILKYAFSWEFLPYVTLLSLGNVATTFLAAGAWGNSSGSSPPSASLEDLPVFSLQLAWGPHWFWYIFIGVFGFEALIQNINLTFADKGILTVSDLDCESA